MQKLGTKRLGIILSLAWLLSPIGWVVIAFGIRDELSFPAIFVTGLFVTPYILGTVYFAYRVLCANKQKSKGEAIGLLAIPLCLIGYFIFRNVCPYRVFLPEGAHDSPFDMVWYSYPQTAYGFPNPIVRIFDNELPVRPFGSRLVDVSSLFCNIWELFGAIFVVFATIAVWHKWRSGRLAANKGP